MCSATHVEKNVMSVLAKLNLKTVHRNVQKDPVIARRQKLVSGIELQQKILEAALRGVTYSVPVVRNVTNDAGEQQQETSEKRARPWFFAQDNGFYVQCRYGARVLFLNGKNNAVWVASLKDVVDVLAAFKTAAQAGEFDRAVALVMARSKPSP
jgi:hypothetical protein